MCGLAFQNLPTPIRHLTGLILPGDSRGRSLPAAPMDEVYLHLSYLSSLPGIILSVFEQKLVVLPGYPFDSRGLFGQRRWRETGHVSTAWRLVGSGRRNYRTITSRLYPVKTTSVLALCLQSGCLAQLLRVQGCE